jgi:hypothetical protein
MSLKSGLIQVKEREDLKLPADQPSRKKNKGVLNMRYTTYTMENGKRSWINELIKKYYVYHKTGWGFGYVDQRVIMDRTGLSYPGWLKILDGSDMKVSTLIKICHAFNIPVEIAIQHECEFLIAAGKLELVFNQG